MDLHREATGGKRSICTARSLSFAPAALVWTAFTLDAEALEIVGEQVSARAAAEGTRRPRIGLLPEGEPGRFPFDRRDDRWRSLARPPVGGYPVVAMLDMRALPSAAAALSGLTEREQVVLRLVAEGLSPREIADRVDLSEDALYRFVAWVLDELAPAPDGETMSDVHFRHGSRPASPSELEEFERRYGPSLPCDAEG